MDQNKEVLRVTESNRNDMIKLFDMQVNSDGFIENSNGSVLECPYENEKIRADDFAIIPGSAIFVKPTKYSFAMALAEEGE